MLFPRVYMDERKAARLLECLKRYRRNVPQSTGEPGNPVHDEFSHAADAFGGLAVVADQLQNDHRTMLKIAPFEPLDKEMGM
jgi:phage terminase large subunit